MKTVPSTVPSSLHLSRALKSRLPLVCATSIALFAASAQAATVVRQNVAGPLNLAAAWDGTGGGVGGIPGATDFAFWNNVMATGANGTAALGEDTIWGGIRIANPAGAVVISAGNTLTLNGVGGVGIDMSAATQNLTIATGLTIGGNQTWNVVSGRNVTLSGGNGIALGANVITLSGGGSVTVNYSGNSPVTPSTSSAGAGLVINGSSLILNPFNVTNFSTAHNNYLGGNTALTMAGGTISSAVAASVGNISQTFTGLTLNAGSSLFATGTRGSSSGNTINLTSLTRNAGSVADFNLSGTATSASSLRFTLPGTALLGGFATFAANDWARANNANSIAAITYTADAWAAANNTNVTVSSAPAADASTNTLRFNTAAANTVTLSGTNTIVSGGILVGSTVAANDSTITGGNLTSGNTNADTTHDLVLINNNTGGGNLVINSNIVDNGVNAVGLTAAVTSTGVVAGAIRLGGTNSFTGPSYINGATVVLTSAGAWNGQSALNFAPQATLAKAGIFALNGNSVTLNGLSTTQAGLNPIVRNANGAAVGNATVTVNLAAGTNTFSGSLQDGAGGGTLSLTKSGNGTLALTRVTGNSYTGNTTVNAGTLSLIAASTNNIASSSRIAVAAGGTLNVTGLTNGTLVLGTQTLTGGGAVTGSVTTTGTSTLTPGTVTAGNAGSGVLTLGNLTMVNGTALNFGLTASPTNNYLSTGTLTLPAGGAGAQVTLNLYTPGTATAFAAAGTYNLFQYSTLNAPVVLGSAFTFGTSISGLTPSFDTLGGFLRLTLTSSGAVGTWTNGGGTGNWNLGANWSGSVPTAPGDGAIFGATAPGTVNLDANKTVGSLTFNNAGNAFTITGANTLTFDNSGNGTSVNVTGTHAVQTAVAFNDNVTVVPGSGSQVTLSGTISEVAVGRSLTLNGAGTLVLTGVNDGPNGYSGGTLINNGVLNFNSVQALGTGGVTLAGGTLQYAVGNVDDVSVRTVTLLAGSSAIDVGANDVVLAAAIGNGGAGGLVKKGAGKLTLDGANTYTGSTAVTNGTLSINSNASLGAPASGAELILQGGTLASTTTLALYNGTLGTNNRALTLGGSGGTVAPVVGTVLTVAGPITGSSLTKTDNGELRILTPVSGQNTFNGGTLISAGTILLGDINAVGTGLGTGTIRLNGGTLSMRYQNGISGSQQGGLANNLVVDTGFTGTLITGTRQDFTGSLTGGGTLNFQTDYVRVNQVGNWSAFTGQINITPNTNGGDFRVNNLNGFGTARIHLANGVNLAVLFNFGVGGATLSVGELAGSSASFLGGGTVPGRVLTWSVGGANTDATFEGTIRDGGVNGGGNGPTAITKVGTGNWTLSGNNTYTNLTTVTRGTITATTNTALGSSLSATAGLVLNPVAATTASVHFTSVTPSIAALASSGAGTSSVVLGDGVNGTPTTLTVGDNNASSVYAGALSDATGTNPAAIGSLTKSGTGMLTLNGTSTYTGVTNVNIGTLVFGFQSALYNNTPASWTTTNLTVAAGATMGFGVGSAGRFTAGNLDVLLALGSGIGGFTSGSFAALDTTGGDFSYGSVIANPNAGANVLGLTKTGNNRLTLSGANTYTGDTLVSAGTLVAAHAQALGASAAGTTVASGATLDVQAALTAESIAIIGAGVGNGGALIASAGTGSVAALVSVTGNASIGGEGTLNLNGGIDGSFTVTKVGTGTTNLAGPQTYDTLTTSAGTTNVNSALGTGTSTVNANATTNFSTSQTLAALNIGAGAVVTLAATPPFAPFAGNDFGSTAVVPEPGTVGLLLVGTLGVLGRRHRRN